jgi:hypothetical protein
MLYNYVQPRGSHATVLYLSEHRRDSGLRPYDVRIVSLRFAAIVWFVWLLHVCSDNSVYVNNEAITFIESLFSTCHSTTSWGHFLSFNSTILTRSYRLAESSFCQVANDVLSLRMDERSTLIRGLDLEESRLIQHFMLFSKERKSPRAFSPSLHTHSHFTTSDSLCCFTFV